MLEIEKQNGDVENQQFILDAKANIAQTWEDLLSQAKVHDRD